MKGLIQKFLDGAAKEKLRAINAADYQHLGHFGPKMRALGLILRALWGRTGTRHAICIFLGYKCSSVIPSGIEIVLI